MGQHYIPREYLRHFAPFSGPETIWMYDRNKRNFKLLPIANVAQKSKFYLDRDERALNELVEGPAVTPLNLLRTGNNLDHRGRTCVATYMQTLLTRVPTHRKKVPEMMDKILPQIAESLEGLMKSEGLGQDEDFVLLKELQEGNYSSLPAENFREMTISQHILPETIAHLYYMSWTVFTIEGEGHFFTSDNPVYYSNGLEKQDSEVAFPLSSTVALVAGWAGRSAGLGFAQTTATQVNRINEATQRGADRFLFGRQKDRRLRAADSASLRKANSKRPGR